jgi:hypothetical protein
MTKRQQSEPNAQPASEAARAAVEWEYRKRPIVVKASQWWRNGDHPHDDQDMFDYPDENGNVFQRPNGEGKVVRYFRRPDVPGEQTCKHCTRPMHDHGWIDTLEGGHIVCPGDYVITGVKGERYPCKPDIFTATYEPVASQPPASEPSGREPGIPDGFREWLARAVGVAVSPKQAETVWHGFWRWEPGVPERECTTADMLRRLAMHLSSGALKFTEHDFDTGNWIAALNSRADVLEGRHPAAPAGEREEVERLLGFVRDAHAKLDSGGIPDFPEYMNRMERRLFWMINELGERAARIAALEASHAALQAKLDAVEAERDRLRKFVMPGDGTLLPAGEWTYVEAKTKPRIVTDGLCILSVEGVLYVNIDELESALAGK